MERRVIVGNSLVGAIGLREATRAAMELDRARAHGLERGLSKDEVEQVVAAWLTWFRTTPRRFDPALIRAALTDRALGMDWLP